MSQLEFPSIISIENNLHCNGKCKFCIRDKITRPKGIMSLDLARRIAEQLTSDTQVIINSWNEPLMTGNFEEMLDIFSSSDIMFYTNGSLLHKRNIFKAIDKCKAINAIYISFNGGDIQGYEDTMGLDFEQTRENVIKLFERVGHRIPIHITANMTDENRPNLNRIRDLFPIAASFDMHYPWDVRGFRGQQHIIRDIIPCLRLEYYMTIAWNGVVQACCNMINNEIDFGNAAYTSIKDIWHSEPARFFREKHKTLKRSEIQTCARCRG